MVFSTLNKRNYYFRPQTITFKKKINPQNKVQDRFYKTQISMKMGKVKWDRVVKGLTYSDQASLEEGA